MAGKLKSTIAGSTSLLLLLLLSLSAIRCEKEAEPVFEEFIFVIPLRITPPDSIVRKGDTLWLTASIADTALEYNSRRYYQFYGYPVFGTNFVLRKLVNKMGFIYDQPGAVDSFEFVQIAGSIPLTSRAFGSLIFANRDNLYELKIAIIPKSSGVFVFTMMDPVQFDLSYLKLAPTEDGRKRIPIYRGILFVFNEGKTNFSLLKANSKSASVVNPTQNNIYYEQKETFTFRVIG